MLAKLGYQCAAPDDNQKAKAGPGAGQARLLAVNAAQQSPIAMQKPRVRIGIARQQRAQANCKLGGAKSSGRKPFLAPLVLACPPCADCGVLGAPPQLPGPSVSAPPPVSVRRQPGLGRPIRRSWCFTAHSSPGLPQIAPPCTTSSPYSRCPPPRTLLISCCQKPSAALPQSCTMVSGARHAAACIPMADGGAGRARAPADNWPRAQQQAVLQRSQERKPQPLNAA